MKRIFIVGCPRSGTSMTQNLLANQQSMMTLPESHFFDLLVARSWVSSFGFASWTGRAKFRAYAALRMPAFEGPFVGILLRDWCQTYFEYLDVQATQLGCGGWVEKTPKHLHFMDEIERYAPRHSFIHIVRDGFSVVRSLYLASRSSSSAWSTTRTIEQCVDRWCHDIQLSIAKLGVGGHHHIAYERLCEAPLDTLNKLYRNLDMPIYDGDVVVDTALHEYATSREETWRGFRSAVSSAHTPRMLSSDDERILADLLSGRSEYNEYIAVREQLS